MSRLARRYARALFEACTADGAADAVAADLQKVAAAFAQPELRDNVLDPRLPRSQRAALLDTVVAEGHELSRNLVQVLVRRRREAVLPELHDAFTALLREARGEVDGVVETPRELEEMQVRALEAAASSSVGKKVTLSVQHNAELIGGVRVRVANTLYDGSLATELEDLERKLMEAPLP